MLVSPRTSRSDVPPGASPPQFGGISLSPEGGGVPGILRRSSAMRVTRAARAANQQSFGQELRVGSKRPRPTPPPRRSTLCVVWARTVLGEPHRRPDRRHVKKTGVSRPSSLSARSTTTRTSRPPFSGDTRPVAPQSTDSDQRSTSRHHPPSPALHCIFSLPFADLISRQGHTGTEPLAPLPRLGIIVKSVFFYIQLVHKYSHEQTNELLTPKLRGEDVPLRDVWNGRCAG